MEKTIENLNLAANVFSEVAYYYFQVLEKEGNGDLQAMVNVDDTEVMVQFDRLEHKLQVTVPNPEFILEGDELAKAEFPVKALSQIAGVYFKKGITEDKGNGCVVVVDGSRYNVWFDEEQGQIRFNMDAEDRKKLEES